jgi:hypothetical protein
VGAFSNDWNYHINLVATMLHHLCKNGFTINPLKCEWPIKKTDWLVSWLTPCGLKPGILHMDSPHNARELRKFLGFVNYYHDRLSHAHIFKPLTDHSGLGKSLY